MTVSYLVSSYNKARFLKAVLESVAAELAQTGGEVLVIDDGSADDSWQLIQDFSAGERRFTVRRQENRGIFNVTNQLLAFASEPWVRLVDCDDPLIAGSTEMLIRTAEQKNADYIFGRTLPYGPAPLSAERLGLPQSAPRTVEILRNPLAYAIRDYNHVPSTTLIRRRSIPADIRLNEDFVSCQDLALALHVFRTATVARLDVPVCHQLVGTANRLSANEALTYFQTIQIIKDFGAREFDALHKHMATRKLVSRAMRWMRRRKLIVGSPVMYARLLLLYAKICVGRPVHWERCLERAAEPYVASLPKSRRPY